VKDLDGKIKEAKNRRNERNQKFEDLKLLLNKKDSDPYTLLSMVSDFKLPVYENSNYKNSDTKICGTTDKKIFAPFAEWIKKPTGEWKLLYRWTNDEKSYAGWHQKCDGKAPTVTIIKTQEGCLFGGYSDIPWPTGTHGTSQGTFIFSLTDGKGRLPHRCLCRYYAEVIRDYPPDSIGFGCGTDIRLYFANPKQSYSAFGSTYHRPDGLKDANAYFAGSKSGWNIEEIETYLV